MIKAGGVVQTPQELPSTPSGGLEQRLLITLDLLERRGYTLPVEKCARTLHGGAVTERDLRAAVEAASDVTLRHGHVVTRSSQHLVDASRMRQARHPREAPGYKAVAVRFTQELIDTCPWVDSVLVAGSLSTGGFIREDDLDFNLVVADDTKYVTYLVALVLGSRLAWRHRHRPVGRAARIPIVPKLVCMNVVWERHQTEPFERDDASMAFELLLNRPIFGMASHGARLRGNPRLVAQFPQMLEREAYPELVRRTNRLGRLLSWLLRARWTRRGFNEACFLVARALHAWVRWTRRKKPEVRERVEFVDAMKHPYAIMDKPERLR